jgi:hypothetical protein
MDTQQLNNFIRDLSTDFDIVGTYPAPDDRPEWAIFMAIRMNDCGCNVPQEEHLHTWVFGLNRVDSEWYTLSN